MDVSESKTEHIVLKSNENGVNGDRGNQRYIGDFCDRVCHMIVFVRGIKNCNIPKHLGQDSVSELGARSFYYFSFYTFPPRIRLILMWR